MPKQFYRDYRPSKESARLIEIANQICTEYTNQGFVLTLRQLYYQFVARGIIANKQTEYDRLGGLVNNARLAGMLDWDAIEDRTRNLERLAHWDSPKEIIEGAAHQFRYDRWMNQPVRVECWIEKEALAGVIEPICNKYRVPFFACRGYVSQSESWRAAQRYQEFITDRDQRVVILHLGDHDPSGIDMTRDNLERLTEFLRVDLDPAYYDGYAEEHLEVRRLALNMNQVKRYNPPPNPAKFTDSRATGYVAKYGTSSWELDALEPKVIADLIEAHILQELDDDAWQDSFDQEQKARAKLGKLAADWTD